MNLAYKGSQVTDFKFVRLTDNKIRMVSVMKMALLFLFVSLIGINTFSQTFRSNSATIRKGGFEIDRTVRFIEISNKEISISNYLSDNTEPLVLSVNHIEEKDDKFDGLCRYYYCTTKNDDKFSPFQKIVVIKKPFSIMLELFLSDNNKYVHDLEING